METRKIELTLEQAKELYKQGGSFKTLALGAFSEEELTKPNLPKSWREWKQAHPYIGEEYLITNSSEIISSIGYRPSDNLLETREDAEAFLTLIKLKRLRDCYRQGWKPDWAKDDIKSVIQVEEGIIIPAWEISFSYFLTFQSEEVRDEFLNNFKNMIEQVKEFI